MVGEEALLYIAAPLTALLPEKAQLVIVGEELLLYMPPPFDVVLLLFEKVQLRTQDN
jgi:hypothetical protein